MELDFFSLECNEVSINEFGDVSGFGVIWGSLYIFEISCLSVASFAIIASHSEGWSWISSLWSAMKCPVMNYEMSVGLM